MSDGRYIYDNGKWFQLIHIGEGGERATRYEVAPPKTIQQQQETIERLREVINKLGWKLHNNGSITSQDWMEIVPDALDKALLQEQGSNKE